MFLADKVQIKTNLAGGNSTATFHTGEYELPNLSKLMLIPQDTAVKVEISWQTGKVQENA